MQHFWLAYLFLSFAVGVACLGVAVALVVRRRDPVSRAFLATYAAFSVLVTSSLLLAFGDAAPGVISAGVRRALEYLESIVGFYGVMLTLPLFVHRVFRVDDRRREGILVVVVLVTLGLQHVTEFALGSTPWDQRGDRFEDGVLIAIVAYTIWVAYAHRRAADVERPLATRMSALMVLSVPVIFSDLILSEDWLLDEDLGLRLYPLLYCVTSVVVTWTLARSDAHPEVAAIGEAAPLRVVDEWGLSERESEVAAQVALGLSNKDVAASLHISPNTVKTHLRTIFEKAGIRSRFELISQMSGARHPNG